MNLFKSNALAKSRFNRRFQPLIIGCALSLAVLPLTNLYASDEGQTAPDFEERSVLTGGTEDTGGGRYLVKFRTNSIQSEVPGTQVESLVNSLESRSQIENITPLLNDKIVGPEGMKQLGELANVYVLEVSTSADPAEVVAELSDNPMVEYIEEDGLAWATATYPNDPYFGSQWGLHNYNDADIDAPEAWDMFTGSRSTIIAVVDTGVDRYHQDLSGKVTAGYDFVNNDSNPMDDHGHGTHVAGIAAAKTNDNRGIAGVCWECQVMPVKVLSSSGGGYWSWVAQGIAYAVAHGAQVINMSLGGTGYSSTLYYAVRAAYNANVTLVASAGNSGYYYCDYYPWYSRVGYPAKFRETISVAATDRYDNRAYFSSCSPYTYEMDVAAPGVSILSSLPYNRYAYWNGTSMAAPHVAGAVGVLLSVNSTLTPDKVKKCLHDSADYLGSWRLFGAGRLNLKTLLDECACTIRGTSGNDTLQGTMGKDVICGFGGHDSIFGLSGDDVLIGGDGNDFIFGAEGDDLIIGGKDDDILYGNEGKDEIKGEQGMDSIWGGPGDDDLSGGTGDDEIYGDEGDDVLDGNEGDDYLDGGFGNDTCSNGPMFYDCE